MAGQDTSPGRRLNGDCICRAAERLKQTQQVLERSDGLIRESQQLMAERNGWNPYLLLGSSQVVTELLRAAIDASAADFGNIQLFDSTNYVLRIVAQHGFRNEFLDYFAKVRDSDSACGAAMTRRSRVIVADVASDSVFRGRASGSVVLGAGVRSVQSTPLVDAYGRFLGVLSTHYRCSGSFPQRALQGIDRVIQRYVPQLA